MGRRAYVMVQFPNRNLLEKCIVTQDYGIILVDGKQAEKKAVRHVKSLYDFDVYRYKGETFWKVVNDAG